MEFRDDWSHTLLDVGPRPILLPEELMRLNIVHTIHSQPTITGERRRRREEKEEEEEEEEEE